MDLPVELYHIIAATSEGAYRAMLAVPAFARSIDVSTRYDYMIMFGHSIEITPDMTSWTKNGANHRLNGPAVEQPYYTAWYKNGAPHRVDGPAVDYLDGYQAWYFNGKRHRTGGPAIIYSYGADEYWEDGVQIR